MGNLLGSPLKKYVNGQIKVRQKVSGIEKNRTLEDITYLNSRTAFVKLASAVYVEENRLKILKLNQTGGNDLLDGVGTGYDLAIRNVLQGGLVSKGSINSLGSDEINTNFQEGDTEKYRQSVRDNTSFSTQHRKGIKGYSDSPAYGVGGLDFGFSPMPGITEVEIKDLSRGSIKKSTLTIKCHNKNQFDVIDVLYLRLGYTVCLEWGWNTFKDNDDVLTNLEDTLIDSEFWKVMNEDYSDFLDKIEKKRKETFGNYDGIIGVISNFSWNFNPDGTYDIKLEITSLGDVIESLKVNLPPLTMGKKTNPYAQQRLQGIKDDLADRFATFEEFYNVLYPGLDKELEKIFLRWINRQKSGQLAFPTWIYDGTLKKLWFINQDTNPSNSDFLQSQIEYNNIADIMGGVEILQKIFHTHKVGDKTFSNYNWGIPFCWIMDRSDFARAKIYGGLNNNSSIHYDSRKDDQLLPRPSLSYGSEENTHTQIIYQESGSDEWKVEPFFPNGSNRKLLKCDILTTEASKKKQLKESNWNTSKLNRLKKFMLMGFNIPGNITNEDVFSFAWSSYGPAGSFSGKVFFPGVTTEKNYEDLSNSDKGDILLKYYGLEGFLYQVYYLAKEFNSDLKAGNKPDEFTDKLKRGDLKEDTRFTEKEEEEEQDKVSDNDKETIKNNLKFDEHLEISKLKNRVNYWFYKIRYQLKDSTYDFDVYDGFDVNYSNKRDKGLKLKDGTFIGRMAWDKGYVDGELEDGTLKDKGTIYSNLPALGERNGFTKDVNIYLQGEDYTTSQTDASKVEDKDEIGSFINELIFNLPNPTTGKNDLWSKEIGYPKYVDSNFVQSTIKDFNKLTPIEKLEKVKKDGMRFSNSKDILKLDIQPIQNSYFIKLELFLEFLNDMIIPKKNTKGSPEKDTSIIRIDTEVETNICYVIDNVAPYNPLKCIFKNEKFFSGEVLEEDVFEGLYLGLDDFIIKGENNSYSYGKFMNVYVNMKALEEIFEKVDKNNQITLFTALKEICDLLNQGLGHINNFEPIIDKEKNLIKLIDQTSIPNLETIRKKLGNVHMRDYELKKIQTPLEVYGYNPISNNSNFVRNVGITTEISKNYATAITIGATSQGEVPGMEFTAFSRWNIGLKDRFKDYIKDASFPDNPKKKFKEENEKIIEEYTTYIENGYVKLGLMRNNRDLTINSEYIGTSKSIIQNYYAYAQAENTKNNYDPSTNEGIIESSIGFLPINLKLEMDGIGGIRIYDFIKINSEFLPSNYPNTLEFICTGVNHALSGNDWVTNLKTIATYTDKSSKSTSASS
jgi:hypothetical protein